MDLAVTRIGSSSCPLRDIIAEIRLSWPIFIILIISDHCHDDNDIIIFMMSLLRDDERESKERRRLQKDKMDRIRFEYEMHLKDSLIRLRNRSLFRT